MHIDYEVAYLAQTLTSANSKMAQISNTVKVSKNGTNPSYAVPQVFQQRHIAFCIQPIPQRHQVIVQELGQWHQAWIRSQGKLQGQQQPQRLTKE